MDPICITAHCEVNSGILTRSVEINSTDNIQYLLEESKRYINVQKHLQLSVVCAKKDVCLYISIQAKSKINILIELIYQSQSINTYSYLDEYTPEKVTNWILLNLTRFVQDMSTCSSIENSTYMIRHFNEEWNIESEEYRHL